MQHGNTVLNQRKEEEENKTEKKGKPRLHEAKEENTYKIPQIVRKHLEKYTYYVYDIFHPILLYGN